MISQALYDAASEKRYNRVPVARWLLTEDFEIVCGMASLHPITIKKVFAQVLNETPIRAQVLCKKLVEQIEQL